MEKIWVIRKNLEKVLYGYLSFLYQNSIKIFILFHNFESGKFQ